MIVSRAHKIRLQPNNRQANHFVRACGIARSTYNWALGQWIEQYKAGDKPNSHKLKKKFNAIKRLERPWVLEVTKCAAEQAFLDLGQAFKEFFRNVKAGKKPGFPRFKKKGKAKDSFYLANDQFILSGKKIRIPKLGWVKLREALRFDGKIMSARVSRTADKWFVSIQVEVELLEPDVTSLPVLGVDVGIKELATVSDGRVFYNPKALKRAEVQMRRRQKAVSRKQKGSNNRKKAIIRLQRQHYRVSSIRNDAIHKATTAIIKSCGVLGVEDLNVAGMLRNHRIARALSDASFGEFFRQIDYKATGHGVRIVKADGFYPSSKTCSGCGIVKTVLSLGERIFRCACGLVKDRDLNAACNLQKMAVGSTVSACCLGSSGAKDLSNA